jgi:phosphoglycolate phosphatase
VRRFIAVYRGRIALESRPFEGVETALTDLADAGARLCVCTNKFTDLSVALLDALDLSRHFAAVIGPDLAPAPKPDARHLIAAVEAAGGRIDRAIMVGDSASDVGAARAAGVASIVGGDYLIDQFSDLPPLAARLLA